jgi:hypothetical protein
MYGENPSLSNLISLSDSGWCQRKSADGEEEVGPVRPQTRPQNFLQALLLLTASSAISPAQAHKNVGPHRETEIEASTYSSGDSASRSRFGHVTLGYANQIRGSVSRFSDAKPFRSRFALRLSKGASPKSSHGGMEV